MRWADHVVQAQEPMTMTMHFQAEEEMGVAYYVRRRKEVLEEAREGLHDDGQLWSEDGVLDSDKLTRRVLRRAASCAAQ